MEEKNLSDQPTDIVINVFKNGTMPTKEEYTRIWIDLINHMERIRENLM